MKWAKIKVRCRSAGLSNGEFCRRCGISESAMNKGLRRDSSMSGAVLKVADGVLAAAHAARHEAVA